MDLKIKGKNAFITGATRGLGLASLKSLARTIFPVTEYKLIDKLFVLFNR